MIKSLQVAGFLLLILCVVGTTTVFAVGFNHVTAVAIDATQTGTVNSGTPGSVTYTVTLTLSGDGMPTSTCLMTVVGTLPTGATAAFSSGTLAVSSDVVTLPGGATTGTVILTITTTTETPQGSTTGLLAHSSYDPYDSGEFSFVVDAPLPVELTSFTAVADKMTARLQWSTASEVNNAGFEIERRQLGAAGWEKIGFVAGNGTSTVSHSYSYTDRVQAGSYAYRLKQIDRNGGYSYSLAAEVVVETPRVYTMSQNYPNPFNPSTVIEYAIPAAGRVVVKVYDAIGREVATLVDAQLEAGSYTVHFDAGRLASGLYIARLAAGDVTKCIRMTLVR